MKKCTLSAHQLFIKRFSYFLTFIFVSTISTWVNAQSFFINTFAGGANYSGDNGPAVSARLNFPSGVVIDSSGNMYFTDQNNNRIRKVNTNGIISTIAGNGTGGFSGDGGSANKAEINGPTGLAIDGLGNIYIADYLNNRIRKVTTNGIITTVAGNGTAGFSGNDGLAVSDSAKLNQPYGVAVDGSGNIYIADLGNICIRKVSGTTGVISTFAGNGTFGYSGDGHAADSAQLFDPYGVCVDDTGNVYIADESCYIRKVNTKGIISTIAGNANSGFSSDGGLADTTELNQPYGVAVDGSGNVYIADTYNNRIRKVTTNGIISTIAGNANSGFSSDGGLADTTELNQPYGVAVDGSGNVYIADTYNNRIRKVKTNGIISTCAGIGNNYSGDGGPALSDSATLISPTGTAIDGSGNVYIADAGNNRICKVNTSGIISTFAGNGTSGFSGDGGKADIAALNYPSGVAVDGSGNVYIADLQNNRIRKVNTSGIISTFAGNGTAGFLGNGGLAVSDSAELYNPSGVAVDGAGNLYIVDALNNRIRMVNTSGIISTFAGNGNLGFSGDGGLADTAGLSTPVGISVDASGNVYIADEGNQRIRKVKPNGIISTIAGNGNTNITSGLGGYSGDGGPADSAELNNPAGVAVDGSGNVYIADAYNNRIRMVTPTGIISTIGGNGTQGFAGDGGVAVSAELYYPYGIALDGSGNVYISDYGNNRIRELTLLTITQTGSVLTSSSATGNQWYLNGAIIPGATGQTYTATQTGTYTDKVTIGGSLATSNEVYTGVEEYNSTDNTLSVYPNPSTGIFNVKSQTEISTIEVLNIMGQTILSQQVNASTASIDLSNQAKGIYFYKASSNGTLLGTGKMIVE